MKPKFSHPQVIRYDHNTFYINGKETFIYSGSFHYYRCGPCQWIDILQKIKAAGFNTVDTYVPWNFHEQSKGELDLTMLNKFLNDCQQMGFYVIVRPGPYICAEWDTGGFPRWLAGKGIGFRSASARDIYWSKHWFNEVLPVIRKHLITNGGTVILLQIENEYDYFELPNSKKAEYLKSLYQDVMQNGIDVPVITCWTKQARNNSDTVFSQIMDAVNGYPGWNMEGVHQRIKSLEQQEPDSPPIFTELQGGWFTAIGDSTVRQVNKLSAEQINALTKYVIAQGIRGLNYYMLYGGTNFDYWGGKEKTTSYDYTAGKFEIDDKKILKASYYSNDWHSIYIDGKLRKDLTGNTFNDFSELNLLKGMHTLKIILENKGRPNIGFMEEKKGIKSLSLLSYKQYRTLKKWKSSVQLAKHPGSNPSEADTAYNDSEWINFIADSHLHETPNDRQAGSWYRKIIDLNSKEADEKPRLIFEGINRNAVIYVNGKQLYKFRNNGRDGPFNVSLTDAAKPGRNLIALYIENEKGRGGIVGPIEFEYGNEIPLNLAQFNYHASLNGKLSGWQKPDYNDSDWIVVQKSDHSESNFDIKWYRTWFKVPQIKGWIAPLYIHVISTGNLQIWLNGKLLGLYFDVGPQNDFYIPKGWLKEKNSLVFVMRSGSIKNTVPELKEFSIKYYNDYVVKKHELKIE